ncbi:MAG: response regulator [Promethearchaeota archaeon]|nr:MAG: response regulator [Candidatus Lokiarchaeota archaeon]
MKPIILVVDDTKEILFNIKIMLEFSDYEVITATNGKEAIRKLSDIKEIPDLILSDIMMPEMNGYNLFRKISSDPTYYHVPFVFFTAKSAPEDIRFGKMLGVDDYITKPFKEKDLLAIIKGKIARNISAKSIDRNISKILKDITSETEKKLSQENEHPILLFVLWSDKVGSKLVSYYPSEKKSVPLFKKIGDQLFKSSIAIYGKKDIKKSRNILLNIRNIEKDAFIFFDSYPDEKARDGTREYMLSFLAPKITYFDSLKIKKIFQQIADILLTEQKFEIEEYWKKIIKELDLFDHFK